MNKSVSVIITPTIVVTIIIAVGLSSALDTYARNTTITPSIVGINSTTIINAINTKIKLIYGDEILHSTVEKRIMP